MTSDEYRTVPVVPVQKGGRKDFVVVFGGPAMSRDMEFLQERLGRDAVGVVRYCISCMAGQLGAETDERA